MPFHMNKSGFGLWNCISKQARYFYKTRSYQLSSGNFLIFKTVKVVSAGLVEHSVTLKTSKTDLVLRT